jgi:hypothetical protein
MAQKKPTVYEFIPKLGQLRDDVLFGDVWEHPDLSKRDRSLITVAMLAALYRTDEMRHRGLRPDRTDRAALTGIDASRTRRRSRAWSD